MPDLFGLDIAGILNDSIESAGGVRSGTLTKNTTGTRTSGNLTAGTNPTSASYVCKGFVERRAKRREGTTISEDMTVVSILGASVASSQIPEVNDTATFDSVTYKLLRLIASDPAAAMYEFEAESGA